MFPAMKTDNVALQLSEKCMTKKSLWQGKIQNLIGFKQNRRLSSSEFLKTAFLSSNSRIPKCKSNRVPSMKSHTLLCVYLTVALSLSTVASSSAAEVKVLTAGAFKQVVLALVPDFENQTGN